jgi:hypothetical protein
MISASLLWGNSKSAPWGQKVVGANSLPSDHQKKIGKKIGKESRLIWLAVASLLW